MSWWDDWLEEDDIRPDITAALAEEALEGDEPPEPLNLSDADMDTLIKKAIGTCLNFNPLFRKDETLIITLYSTLKGFYVQKKKYVLLSAPTGTGKSIIGDLVHFCSCYIDWTILGAPPVKNNALANFSAHTYFLTSSKALQEQLEADFDKFSLHDQFTMLKGTSNYLCTEASENAKMPVYYPDRECAGMKRPEIMSLPCYDGCPYMQKRLQASEASCAVINYAYFLNVMRMPSNPYFSERTMTIADEAHLLPDVILGMFNMQFTQYNLNRVHRIFQQVELNFKNAVRNKLEPGWELLMQCFRFFQYADPSISDIKEYYERYVELNDWLKEFSAEMCKSISVFESMFKKEITKLSDEVKAMATMPKELDELSERPDDLFIESEYITNTVIGLESYKTFKHTVYDMSEAEMCRKHFLSKVDRVLFMSATIGNIDEFATLMGIAKEEYVGFRLASNFDFSKSPIYLTKSGYLNYASFNENITSVLLDAIKIAETRHFKQKGIIHTATFQIAEKLRDLVKMPGRVPHYQRYLFYTNSTEKEECIKKMKDPKSPGYVIVGPSLYEGLDLAGDQGRFNIIVKAPYSGLTEYTKRKMKRFPFWYERQTLEKLVQAIGRTNRYVDDQSTVYLLDGLLEKLIFKTQDFISGRAKYIKL
jgi:Rad3-related DNA helicase